MGWQYIIRTGAWLRDGHLFMLAYAGRGDCKNDPTKTSVAMLGPLPVGDYTIGDPYDGGRLGPVCFKLEPNPSNRMFGRSLFRLHADSIVTPGDASEGCIVSLGLHGKLTGRQCRDAIASIVTGGDRALRVVAESKDASWTLPPPDLR